MKYFKIVFIPLVLTIILSIGCEPDDICSESTSTTPGAVIDVYEFSIPENKKNIFDLIVVGVGNNYVLPGYNFVSVSKLVLPLKTDSNSTQYILIKEAFVNDNGTTTDTSDDFIDGIKSIITFNYSRENVFVSRACGYKTIFKNVTLTIENTPENWILSQESINPNQSIENETTTHFNLYH